MDSSLGLRETKLHIFIIWQAIFQSKSSVLIGWFSVRILQHGPLPWKRSFLDIFFRATAPAKFKL